MVLGTLDTSLLENLLTGEGTIKLVKVQLDQARIFNAVSSFK